MLKPGINTAPETPSAAGYIDFHGYAAAAGGWLFCGWVTRRWADNLPADAVVAHFERGQLCATILNSWHDRPDIAGRGIGIVVFLGATGRILGDFVGLEVRSPDGTLRIQAAQTLAHLREADLVARTRPLVVSGTGSSRVRLLALLSRQIYEGASTLARLPVAIHLAVDESILVPPDGMLLIGWFIDPTQSVRSIRLRSGSAMSDPLQLRWVGVDRPDIVAALEPKYGSLDRRCGFVAYAPASVADLDRLYLEVELKDGEIGYEMVPRPVRRGLPAIRRVLECIELTPDELEATFDKVIGAPLVTINRLRLAGERRVTEMAFGPQPDSPVCSVIVPLYGRMDFAMFQLALLSEHGFAHHELIYVLDDPPRKRELLDLAQSAYARFGLPFRIILLDTNLGYAPANNVGLARARGEFICFLNSDVMPREPGWLDLMIEDLRQDPTLGILGAMLLFEDGTVQHDGMTFTPLPQFAGWPFPMHPGKGRMPSRVSGVRRAEAVTGACMTMRRALAQDLRGFDEDYITGDFEDTDLCLRVRDRGLWPAVDARVVLYHLERQSQVTPDRRWRSYLSLLNAWTHTRRWFRQPSPPASRV
jgi:GT2 family glycosyltransferase